MSTPTAKTVLFVYGTLKRGQINNVLLSGQTFLGSARTLPIYQLFHLTWYPGMVQADGPGHSIKGELWEVDASVLQKLDILEDIPNLYVRAGVALADYHGDVQTYLYNAPVPANALQGTEWPLTH